MNHNTIEKNDNPAITSAEFAQFQALIYKIAGISLADSKQVLLVGRLTRRLKYHELSSFGEYYRMLASGKDPDELQLMVDLLTTNETYFFREEKHFDYLSDVILAKHPHGSQFDVWSAACSTGEEVYTLAMVLAAKLGIGGPWSVTGSDISLSVLAAAERGLYPMERKRGMPPEYLRRYCLKGVRAQEGSFLIAKDLRSQVRFMQVNLNKTLEVKQRFHVIFLRNVMIYFDQETKRQVVERLARQLHPRGYLIIGHSESLNGITNCVTALQPTIYQLP